MSNILNLKGVKLFAIVVLAAAILATFGMVAVQKANADCSINSTLRLGSKGAEVMCLQSALGGLTADGNFGPKTKAAVVAWQANSGLSADGVFGPLSRAVWMSNAGNSGNFPAGCASASGYSSTTGAKCDGTVAGGNYPAGCTSTTGYSPTTGAKCDGSDSPSTPSTPGVLGSGDGDISNINEVSSADSSLAEGETDELFAFEFDVEGNISVNRVDFYIEETGSGSSNADDYFQSATLSVDGEEIGTVDVSDWTEDDYDVVTDDGVDEFRIRFSGLKSVFADGDNPKFAISFEANGSIDTTDQASSWLVETATDSIRFVDGNGFSTEDGVNLTETFGVDSEDVAKLSVQASSNDVEATTIETSTTDTTEKVPVFTFEIEEENGVDATINDMTVTITALTAAGLGVGEATVFSDAYLYEGSTLLGSESVATGGVVQFTDIGLDIGANDTAELTVKLTVADASDFAEGDTVSVTIAGSTDIDDATDANGNDEGDMTLTGTATSETHQLRSSGIIVVFDSSSYLKTTSDTSGIDETVQFTLEFDVTAFGADMYIDKTCSDSSAPDTTLYVTAVAVSLDGDADGSSTTCTDFDSTGDEGTNAFEVLEGQTEHFTVTVLGLGGEAGTLGTAVTYTARLESIAYVSTADAGGDTVYSFNLSDYKSSAVTVYDRTN